jgi:plasmid stabilization system protein ParE
VGYRVRFTPEAEADLVRLYEFILERDASDWTLAKRALRAIKEGFRILGLSPFTCRKAKTDTPLLRELVIPFGATGYVALFEIDNAETVTVLAVRHQRESDYH